MASSLGFISQSVGCPLRILYRNNVFTIRLDGKIYLKTKQIKTRWHPVSVRGQYVIECVKVGTEVSASHGAEKLRWVVTLSGVSVVEEGMTLNLEVR